VGYGDERQAEDVEAMQADNTHSTGVESDQSEEPERGAVGGRDVRNDEKAPCFEGEDWGVEDSVDCGEGILGDRNATVECQPQDDMSTTMEVREGEVGRKSEVGSGGGSHSN